LQERRLTPTSYIILGLLEQVGEATPYELKQMVARSIGEFWSLQHAQLYSEPERLTESGHLTEEREQDGRRRRRYALTDAGRAALSEWRQQPTTALREMRDPALLQLFFGADPAALAHVQLDAHRRKLSEYGLLEADLEDAPLGPRLALEAGIRHEREWIAFWQDAERRARD
jgi:PadR family transcriptional regulator, regulatory protein AphA